METIQGDLTQSKNLQIQNASKSETFLKTKIMLQEIQSLQNFVFFLILHMQPVLST